MDPSRAQRNLGLFSILKMFLENSGNKFAEFKKGLKLVLKQSLSENHKRQKTKIDTFVILLRKAYFRTFLNILADLAILAGMIFTAINYKLLLALLAGAVIATPPLLFIGLGIIAIGLVVRSITSIIYNFNKEPRNNIAIAGNTFILAAVGLLVASIFIPPLMPLLLPLAIAAGILGGNMLSNSGKEMSTTSRVLGNGLIIATVALLVASVFFPPLLPTLFIIAAATTVLGGTVLYNGDKEIESDSKNLHNAGNISILIGVVLTLAALVFPPIMPMLLIAAGFTVAVGYVGLFKSEKNFKFSPNIQAVEETQPQTQPQTASQGTYNEISQVLRQSTEEERTSNHESDESTHSSRESFDSNHSSPYSDFEDDGYGVFGQHRTKRFDSKEYCDLSDLEEENEEEITFNSPRK
jgi:hypothetical protein